MESTVYRKHGGISGAETDYVHATDHYVSSTLTNYDHSTSSHFKYSDHTQYYSQTCYSCYCTL